MSGEGTPRTVAANLVNQILYNLGALSAVVPAGPLRERVDDETEHAAELSEMIGRMPMEPWAGIPAGGPQQ